MMKPNGREPVEPDRGRSDQWCVVVHTSLLGPHAGDAPNDIREILDCFQGSAPVVSISVMDSCVAIALDLPAAHAQSAVTGALSLVEGLLHTFAGEVIIEAVAAMRPGGVNDPASLDGVLDLVGVEEVGLLLELSPTSIRELVSQPGFPIPVAQLAQGPVWRRSTILSYLSRAANDEVLPVGAGVT